MPLILRLWGVTFVLALCTSLAWSSGIALPSQPALQLQPNGIPAKARIVWLTATIRYVNPSRKPINVVHSVTIPAHDVSHQRVLWVSSDVKYAKLMRHKNRIDRYLKMRFSVPANSTVEHNIRFKLLLQNSVYKLDSISPSRNYYSKIVSKYLEPDRLSPSNSPQINSIAAQLMHQCRDDKLCAIEQAFRIPSQRLKFQKSPIPVDAVSALSEQKGDCTEFSSVFVALARALGIPARRTSKFSIKSSTQMKMPNHNSTEIYWPNLGWIPADPNLGIPGGDSREGLGKTGRDTILFARQGTWTWANKVTPKNSGYKVQMKWQVNKLAEGASDLLLRGEP